MKSLNAFDEYLIENFTLFYVPKHLKLIVVSCYVRKPKPWAMATIKNEHDEAGLAESTFQLQQQIFSRGFATNT